MRGLGSKKKGKQDEGSEDRGEERKEKGLRDFERAWQGETVENVTWEKL